MNHTSLPAALAGLSIEDIQAATNLDPGQMYHQCHLTSIEIVHSGLFQDLGFPARVARGSAHGVLGQHSWVVLGADPYDQQALIADATLWSYKPMPQMLYLGDQLTHRHVPKGSGSIWEYGKPSVAENQLRHHERLALTPTTPLSDHARRFLQTLDGDLALDVASWMQLANSPVGGWPAKEIITAMLDTPQIAAFVPVDVAGMLTDRNPGGSYLREGDFS